MATNSPRDPDTPLSRAEAVFAAFQRSVEAGEPTDFDAVCRAHADLETELRALKSQLRFTQPQVDSGPSSELLHRLRTQAPTSSRYQIVGEVARGGMGAILKVWDDILRRALAMKVVLGDESASAPGSATPVEPKTLGRFLEEAQVTGQLDHPGIVPVYELGLSSDGRAYFTMRLVKGDDLRHVFDLVHAGKDGWNQTRALGVLLKVCEAMSYAHDKGVIHRDLKPANVMVGKYGEVYVMDWGLARVLGEEDRHDLRLRSEPPSTLASVKTDRREQRDQAPDSPLVTMDGDVVGTPSYMPPEQANGQLAELGPHSDVYSVGAMLYHLLTGEMPFVPKDARMSQQTILLRVIEGPPKPLQDLAPQTPAELIAICEKAMARDKQQRYPDMLAMADDLRAYLENRVVKAHRTGAVVEFTKWVQRNKGMAAALLAAVLVLIGGLVTTLMQKARADENAALAKKNEDRAIEEAGRASTEATRAKAQEERAAREARRALSLSGMKRLQEQEAAAEKLWPRRRDKIGTMNAWLEESRTLVAETSTYQSYLAELEAEGSGEYQKQWLHDNLKQLVNNLGKFQGLIADVEQRLEIASTIEAKTVDEQTDAWNEATAAIAKNELYRGLALEPQIGLVPLGEDPESKLWEFWVWESGERPERETTKRWKVTGETGIVLVLLPGGTFFMGSQKQNPLAPNYDPNLLDDESPVQQVTLTPYFLSKYELTQGQWRLVMGSNPSWYKYEGEPRAGAHPVEEVSYDECVQMLFRIGLVMPTEAQWEYGARGGTTTPWWSGSSKESLKQAANTADESFRRVFRDPGSSEPWDDGSGRDAPVGSFRANGFGLHDTAGNVWELCRDCYGPYARPVKPDDGERSVSEGDDQSRVYRGGSYTDTAVYVRSARRFRSPSAARFSNLGVRPARAIDP